MLDTVHARVDGRLDGDLACGMGGNLLMGAMSFLYDGGHGRRVNHNAVVVERDFDNVHGIKKVLIYGTPPFLRVCDHKKFLPQDGFGKRGIKVLDIVPQRSNFQACRKNPRAGTRPALMASRSAVSPSIPEWP